MKDKSKKRANQILEYYIANISKFDFLISVILVGSLSDDTYTGNKGSDIDLVHIIDNENYEINRLELLKYISVIEDETKDIPISKVIYKHEDLFHPYNYNFDVCVENKDRIELPIEILRLKYSGKTLFGKNLIAEIEEPTIIDIEKSIELSNKLNEYMQKTNPVLFEQYLKNIENPSSNILVQIVLTKAISHYYFLTNKNCSSKKFILFSIEKDIPNFVYLDLLRLCHKWRFENDDITKQEIDTMHYLYKLHRVAGSLK